MSADSSGMDQAGSTAAPDEKPLPRVTVVLLATMGLLVVGFGVGTITWVLARPGDVTKCEDVKAVLPPDAEGEFGPLTMNAQCQLVDRNGYVRVDRTFEKP